MLVFFSFFSQRVCLIGFCFGREKAKSHTIKPGCEYSVAASLKTSIESGYKTHLNSQFMFMVLMNDTIITKERQISFCQLSVEGNDFSSKGECSAIRLRK